LEPGVLRLSNHLEPGTVVEMAYTDDAVLAKLSALNETQESIVTVAQWVMFHRYEVLSSEAFKSATDVNKQETCRSHRTAMASTIEGLWQQQEIESHLSCKRYAGNI
jgi:hypothetical protein